MAITLPTPIRIAAGLLGTALDHLIKLPEELPTLGISLAGQAVRTSLRVQQQLAELATRGDELLAPLTGGPQDRPPWATFDDEDDRTPGTRTYDRGSSVVGSVAGDGAPTDGGGAGGDAPADGGGAGGDDTDRALHPAGEHDAAAAEVHGPEAESEPFPIVDAGAEGSVVLPGDIARAAKSSVRTRSTGTRPRRSAARTPLAETSSQLGDAAIPGPPSTAPTDPAIGRPLDVAGSDGPVADFGGLTVSQLAERLDELDTAAVRALLAQEEDGRARAPFLTLLTNRVTKLEHQSDVDTERH